MAEINNESLALIIQTVVAEINRLRALPDGNTAPDDEVRLVDFENLAEELAEKYEEVRKMNGDLPDYSLLIRS